MTRLRASVTVLAVGALLCFAPVAGAAPIYLDMETPTTGSMLGTTPLVTGYGTISFLGEFWAPNSDADFLAAGAFGNVLDIANSPLSNATLSFSFNVLSVTFIYGGNDGVFDMRALDSGGNLVASFFQASTGNGQPAGPVTLSGSGIRSLFWQDPGNSYAAIDNITIQPQSAIPEPASLLLLGTGLIGLRAWRKRRD